MIFTHTFIFYILNINFRRHIGVLTRNKRCGELGGGCFLVKPKTNNEQLNDFFVHTKKMIFGLN